MGFRTYGSNGQAKTSDAPKTDWNALNEYVVEVAQLQQRETLIGYVSGIVDLGIQEQEDAEFEFDGDAEDEQAEIEKNPAVYFKDGFNDKKQPVRYLCKPQKAVQSVAVAVDFPDIIVDKGQFFGKSNPQPLRVYMGGQFFNPTLRQMTIGRPTPLKETTKTGKWSLDKKNLFHKMAVSSKLITPDEPFKGSDIDQLLGKAFQWEVQIYFKENKGKKYYTEFLKFVGGLGRGQVAPELTITPFLIQFDDPNTEEVLGNLRNHVINTIKQAKNYEGSAIQKQLESGKDYGSEASEDSEDDPSPTPAPAAKKPARQVKPVVDDEDTDCPF